MLLEKFETFRRPENLKISDYLTRLNNYTTKPSPMKLKCQRMY